MYKSGKETVNFRSTSKFLKQISVAYRIILKTIAPYTDSILSPLPVITDNIHIIKRSYFEAIQDLRAVKKIPFSANGLPRLYEHIYAFCKYEEGTPTVDSLDKMFQDIKNRMVSMQKQIPTIFHWYLRWWITIIEVLQIKLNRCSSWNRRLIILLKH